MSPTKPSPWALVSCRRGVAAGDRVRATVTLADAATDTKTGAPSVDSVTITSAPGLSGAYGVNEEITVQVAVRQARQRDRHTANRADHRHEHAPGPVSKPPGARARCWSSLTPCVNGESDADGISIAANGLALNGGTIRDKESTPQDAYHHPSRSRRRQRSPRGRRQAGATDRDRGRQHGDADLWRDAQREFDSGGDRIHRHRRWGDGGGQIRPGVQADRQADPELVCYPEPDRHAELYLPSGATDSGLVRQRRGILLQPGGDEHDPGTALRHRR